MSVNQQDGRRKVGDSLAGSSIRPTRSNASESGSNVLHMSDDLLRGGSTYTRASSVRIVYIVVMCRVTSTNPFTDRD